MITPPTLVDAADAAVSLVAVTADALASWAEARPRARQWIAATGFKADTGASLLVPGDDGALGEVILGLGRGDDPWATGGLAKGLPKGTYRLAEVVGLSGAAAESFPTWAALAWALGAYQFTRYRKDGSTAGDKLARLQWPVGADRGYVARAVAGATLTRDLINTPAADMLPDTLAARAEDVAKRHGAQMRITIGDDLMRRYPLIHAVGRASTTPPRFIDFTWGDPVHPRVTLVGKGVCFDTGGLDLKPASAMGLMKKDMGGAATILGLAEMIMDAKIPVRLRVMIPAVENAVAGNAFRPGDVLVSRAGLTVEIGNTDAEGRLVLADALTEASAEQPTLLIDCATLTGAARTALGPELPAVFTDDESLASDLAIAAKATHDPLWRLPLWTPYRKMIDSKVADMNNAGDSPFAGAITAALFLKEFVSPAIPWVHVDSYAWNPSDRAGRPQGGEALTQRALFELIRRRFG